MIEDYISSGAKESDRGLRLQREEGNSQESEKNKYFVNKVACRADKFVWRKVISENSSLPGINSLSNVNFLYKGNFTLFSELFWYLPFLKIIPMPKRLISGYHILLTSPPDLNLQGEFCQIEQFLVPPSLTI